MTDKTKAEEAQLAADVAAEHAEKAAAVADKAETAALREASESGKVCPACKGELIQHDDTNASKAGAWHCNSCGICWKPGLKEPRYP